MESKRVADWRKARGLFEQVIDRNDDPKLVAKAEQLYQESRRRTLVQQAEQGFFLLSQSKNAKTFGEAVKLQQEGKADEAIPLFEGLVESIDPEGDERYIRIEAKSRLAAIAAAEPDLPADPAELLAIIEPTLDVKTESELLSARRLLSRIILEFAGEDGYAQVVEQAKNGLTEVDERLELINNLPPDLPPLVPKSSEPSKQEPSKERGGS